MMNATHCECGHPTDGKEICDSCDNFHAELDNVNAEKIIEDLNKKNMEYFNKYMRISYIGTQLRKEIYR